MLLIILARACCGGVCLEVVEHASADCSFIALQRSEFSCVVNSRLESVTMPRCFCSEVVVRATCTLTTTSMLRLGAVAVWVLKWTGAYSAIIITECMVADVKRNIMRSGNR